MSEIPEDYRPNRESLTAAEIRATGILAGGAVANIARELIQSRERIATLIAERDKAAHRAQVVKDGLWEELRKCGRERDVYARGLEAEEKDCTAAEAERDALEAQLNALQEVWRTTVGDGTDKLTATGLKSLIEDYQAERDEMKDNAEIGEALLDTIKNFQPNYNWNTRPSEIVRSLTNERDALQKQVSVLRRTLDSTDRANQKHVEERDALQQRVVALIEINGESIEHLNKANALITARATGEKGNDGK